MVKCKHYGSAVELRVLAGLGKSERHVAFIPLKYYVITPPWQRIMAKKRTRACIENTNPKMRHLDPRILALSWVFLMYQWFCLVILTQNRLPNESYAFLIILRSCGQPQENEGRALETAGPAHEHTCDDRFCNRFPCTVLNKKCQRSPTLKSLNGLRKAEQSLNMRRSAWTCMAWWNFFPQSSKTFPR